MRATSRDPGALKVATVSVTKSGRELSEKLPYRHFHGNAGETIRSIWNDIDALVVFLSLGATVRIIAPLLTSKAEDPGVVCVDEAGQYVIALSGGHAGGANRLAEQVALALGAQAIVTTATDVTDTLALDTLSGFTAKGDISGVTTALLDGTTIHVDNPRDWPLPRPLVESALFLGPLSADGMLCSDDASSPRIIVTDENFDPEPGEVLLCPPSLVAGIGASSGAPGADIANLLASALNSAGLDIASVSEIATVDLKANEPGILELGLPVRCFSAECLAAIDVPTPSDTVALAVGTPSVAEAAALRAAGPGGELVVPKQKSSTATVAIARRKRPRGHLALVGLGPGLPAHRTPAAGAAVVAADVLIGYTPYLELCSDLIGPHQTVMNSPIGDEVLRAREALTQAATGRRVAMVCSGDSGVYAMASIVLELAADIAEVDEIDVEVIPGVTAALSAAAALGAPLGHDHVSISLSDLLTPWEVIEGRLQAAATSDLVVTIYNPRSRGRDWQLDAAREILLAHRGPETPVGIVTDAGRPDCRVQLSTLGTFEVDLVTMTTCVIIGSSATRVIQGRMVTPRGYQR